MFIMLIKPFRKYVVVCRGEDSDIYRWHLKVEPWYKAWKVANYSISVGDVFKGYFILYIDDVTYKPYGEKFDDLKLWGKTTSENDFILEDSKKDQKNSLEFWEVPISEYEFDFAVETSNIGFAAYPSYSQSFRCQICGGVVANDICTDCMFDWDS